MRISGFGTIWIRKKKKMKTKQIIIIIKKGIESLIKKKENKDFYIQS